MLLSNTDVILVKVTVNEYVYKKSFVLRNKNMKMRGKQLYRDMNKYKTRLIYSRI